MADDINEVCDITSISDSLVINMGTLNERSIKSMIVAGKKANEIRRPVVFDPVGAGASPFRNETALKLMEEVNFSVIRGNASEIKFLANNSGNTQGVDAGDADRITKENLDNMIDFVKSFAKRTGSVIVATGEIDIVADENKVYLIENGHPMMCKVSGTGCMLSSVIGSYIGANPNDILEAAAVATCAMGLSGELAYQKVCAMDGGTGSYRMYIIDFMSKITGEILAEGGRVAAK